MLFWLTLLQKQASASFIPNYIQESHTFNNMTRRDVSRSPMRERKLSPIRMSDSEDSDRSEHKDGAEAPRRKPLRHLALLALALLFGAILGAVSTSDSTASTIVAPPHSRLRFVESKTTEEQPARPTARRPSTRRLRFTKI